MIPVYTGIGQEDIVVDYTFLHSAEFPDDPKVEHVSNEAGSWELVETAAVSTYWYTVKGGMELLIKKMNGRFEVTKTNQVNCSIVAMMREEGNYKGGINRAEYVSCVCRNGHLQEVDGLEIDITHGLPCIQCYEAFRTPIVTVANTPREALQLEKAKKWAALQGMQFLGVEVFLSRIDGYRMRNPDDKAEFTNIDYLHSGLKIFGFPMAELDKYTLDDLLAQQSAGNAILNHIFETLYHEKFENASQDSLANWALSASRPLAEAMRVTAAYDIAVIQTKLWGFPIWKMGVPSQLKPREAKDPTAKRDWILENLHP